MKRQAGAWACVACLLVSGCGFGYRGESAPAAFLPRGTKPIVKIGLVAPFEGRYRALGYEVLYAVKWAVRQRNGAGGVAGYMIELITLDDGDDPESSAFQALKFGIDQGVVGVVGPFSEAAAQSAASVYHELGLAMVTPAMCSRSLVSLGYGEVFCLGASAEVLGHALVERLPANARVTLVRAEKGPLGDQLLPSAQRVLVAPWTESTLRELPGDAIDVYLYDGDVLSAAELLMTMRRAGNDAPLWGGPSLARTQLPQIAGDAATGACYALTAPLLADLSPEGAFVVGYQELAGTTPGLWAALAYDATMLLLDALEQDIEAAGRPTRQGIIARLGNVRGPDGQPVFKGGRRRHAETTFRCYGRTTSSTEG